MSPRLSAWASQPRSGGKLTDQGIEPQISRTASDVLTTDLTEGFFRRLTSKTLEILEKNAKDPKLKAYCSILIDRQFFLP